VADMTTAELKKIKFNRTHPEYEHATIPTLREVYELLKPYGLKVNAELKNSIIDYPNLEEKCIKLAYETGMTDNVLYSSFNHYSMLRVKKIDPKLPVGLLYECMLIDPWDYAKKLGADAIHPHFSELQVPGEAEKTHALGMAVNVWTVNEEKDIRFSIEAGADIIISNYPDVAIKVLGEHQK